MSDSDPTASIACTLTEEQQQDRAARIRSTLAAGYEGAAERDDGYTLVFDGDDETLSALAAFVANERRCCSFAAYTIDVSPPYDETRLTITGPDGTTDVFDGLPDLFDAAAGEQ